MKKRELAHKIHNINVLRTMDNVKEHASICMDIIEYAIENFPVSKENAREVIDYLMQREDEWFYIGEECYQGIIFNLSEAYRLECGICTTISFLNEQLEKFPIVYKRAYNRKSILFLALGTYYAYLHDSKKAIEAFQKWIFYSLIPKNRYHGFEFYSFRACNKYALDDLRNNTMTVSNPATFNDPLDCLLLHYFDNLKNKTESLFDGNVYKLAKEAHSYVKIRCFVRNIPLPMNKDEETTPRSKVEERYNPLMWAHYADGHKGYCVKYKFPASMTEVKDGGAAEVCVFSLWGNINYVDSIDLNEQLNVGDAFFTKNKVWEYENEVRFLHYDPQWKGDIKPIELPVNSIEEIYFGLNCSSENIQKIREALVGQRVKFFQIETQPHDFYKLTSREV